MADFSSTTGFLRARSPDGNLSFFKIERSLSLYEKGGVYQASCNGRAYALKLFPVDCDLFESESRFTTLSHPNILPPQICESGVVVLDGDEKPYSFILSEFCSHGDFEQLLRKNFKFDEKLARTYFKQLVTAVEYLYDNDVAHCDIKTGNVFLDENFTLRLGDFDLAYQQDDNILTRGTNHYRAPEVAKGGFYCPYRADVYSMAVFLFYILTGVKLPFREDVPEEYEMYCKNPKRFWEEMEKTDELAGVNFTEDFKVLFEGMTRAKPEDRFYLDEIQGSDWFDGEVYDEKELKVIMEAKMKRLY